MLFPRFISSPIIEALADRPVVLITGARQTGKTTLVREILKKVHSAQYITLDDLSIRNAAQNDPQGFLARYSGPLIIDEIQLAPELLSAIKLEVDSNRQAGRFLLTGSANVLTVPRISESLAGRMEIFNLFPLSQGELSSKKEAFIDWLFSEKFELSSFSKSNDRSLMNRIINGGYPEIVQKSDASRKEAWFRNYVTTILQRDIRDLANINGLTQMPRLLELLATRITTLVNFSELSRSIQIPHTSLKRYLALFETTFLTYRLPSWSGNLGKRIVKSPKLFFTDSGLASSFLGEDIDSLAKPSHQSGALLENFILSELYKQKTWSKTNPHFFHFRSQTGQEVDFILEDRKRRCIGIEVKSSSTVRFDDFKALKWFKENTSQFLRGIVLYRGQEMIPFGGDLYAVPIDAMWQVS